MNADTKRKAKPRPEATAKANDTPENTSTASADAPEIALNSPEATPEFLKAAEPSTPEGNVSEALQPPAFVPRGYYDQVAPEPTKHRLQSFRLDPEARKKQWGM